MRLKSIQCLRAVAAIGVVLFHLKVFNLGWAGVDLFFVISGYIMGSVGATQTSKDFITSRFTRIAPLYWLITLTVCLVSLIPGLFRTFSFTYGELFSSLFFIPYLNRTGYLWPLIVPGWTLNFEVFFYALFAIGLLIRTPKKFAITGLVILVLIGAFFHPKGAILQVWTSPLLIEFAAGLILSAIDLPARRKSGLLLIGLGAIGAVFANFVLIDDHITLTRIVLCGSSAALIVTGGLMIEKAGWWPRQTILLERIGDSSYSLYLIHGIIIASSEKLYGTNPLIRLVTFFVCLLSGWLVYRCVETSLTRAIKRRMTAPPEPLKVQYSNSLAA